ncbi:MAG: acetolactate synthase small subunit [Firmicutes bacterium HGW-Firmicutes-1]|jgi:acetolactate synthase-1/3 small subunit|nr:MAG: acetolactate synthase small subunit [Firmicutes bacterium HGW-Firmicutes-1]
MKRHVLSVLVSNQSGVLSRVAGLFSRRGFNIDSLSVGETEHEDISRMTIVVTGDDLVLDQITKQLDKLHDVLYIKELTKDAAVYRELLLIKVQATNENRAAIIEITDIFRAKIIDVASESLVVEVTGDQAKLEAFINLIEPYGIKEFTRTGLTALQRGNKVIKDNIK